MPKEEKMSAQTDLGMDAYGLWQVPRRRRPNNEGMGKQNHVDFSSCRST